MHPSAQWRGRLQKKGQYREGRQSVQVLIQVGGGFVVLNERTNQPGETKSPWWPGFVGLSMAFFVKRGRPDRS